MTARGGGARKHFKDAQKHGHLPNEISIYELAPHLEKEVKYVGGVFEQGRHVMDPVRIILKFIPNVSS